MTNKLIHLTLMLIFASGTAGKAQDSLLKQQLQVLNKQRDLAMSSRDADGVAFLYSEDAVCMPEFHPVIQGRLPIQHYFSLWMKSIRSSSYTSKTHDLIRIKNSVIETGTFTDTLISRKNDTLVYNGKYMRHWQFDDDHKLRIEAEIWGATNYIDRAHFPYTGTSNPVSMLSTALTQGIATEIKARNDLITRLVKERKGGEHAALFTKDAIYMPYYMPMMTGIDQVRSYFTDHEKPGDVIIDSISITKGRIMTIDKNTFLEHGFYFVRWIANDKSTGVVTGKSLNLWKRNEKGVLMLHRQMVNHN